MKIFLTLFLIVIFVGGGYLAYQKIKTIDTSSQAPDLNVTLTGRVTEVKGNSQYSYQLEGKNKTTGLNSSHVDLSKYNGENVTVTGQYSGTVLYVDRVNVNNGSN